MLRPVMRGLCRFESLVDGSLSLEHVALMNDAIGVETENVHRIRKAQQP